MGLATLSMAPLLILFTDTSHLRSKFQTQKRSQRWRTTRVSICCSNGSRNSSPDTIGTTQQQQQPSLSVLRFTLGIPGLDESYLPRWLGYAFGSLLLLNHFAGSDLSATTPAQFRTEILGLSLAAFSVVIPYLGKFLKGATPVTDKSVPQGAEQIFFMSNNLPDVLKEDLAWATYILLRNSNTTSVLISVGDAICVRGYWDIPIGMSKDQAIERFKNQIQQIGLSNLKDTLYFIEAADYEMQEMLPTGTRSLLVQPVPQGPNLGSDRKERIKGLFLLASTNNYAYSKKDRAWIEALANKFRGESSLSD